MPNHVKHDIIFSGARVDVDAVLEAIKGEDGTTPIDFERLIPMPEAVRKTTEEPLSFLEIEEMRARGEENWYDWCIDHWETKWNAFDAWTEVDGEGRTILHFSTAWATPRPILLKLAEICKDHSTTIEGLYADEDYGANCGKIDMDGARRVQDGSPLAEEIAGKVWGEQAE